MADELERSAVRARARGGQAAAAAFLERSVDLTLDPARRAERALAAAEARYLAGSGEDALRLAAVAERGPLDELHRARVDVLRGRVATMQRRPRDAPPLLLGAARRLERFDRGLARETYRDAFIAAIYAGRFAGDTGLPEVAAAIRSAAPSAEPPSATDELLDAAALLIDAGWAAGAAPAQRALADFVSRRFRARSICNGCSSPPRVLSGSWDPETWDALSGRMLELVRDAGVLALLPMAAAPRVGWELFAGDLAAASALVAEQDTVQEAIGGDSSPGSRIALAAYRGREAEVAQLDEATTRDAVARGDGPWVAMLHWSTAVLCNGLGRYDEALGLRSWEPRIRPTCTCRAGRSVNWSRRRCAAVGPRRPPMRSGGSRRWRAPAAPTGSSASKPALARSSRTPPTRRSLYRDAIERLGRTPFRTELARAQLLYGEWLRREGRRVDARVQLRAAYDQFTSIGMEAFAERARGSCWRRARKCVSGRWRRATI